MTPIGSNKNWIGRIASNSQSIKVVAQKGDFTFTKIYSLNGLVLN